MRNPDAQILKFPLILKGNELNTICLARGPVGINSLFRIFHNQIFFQIFLMKQAFMVDCLAVPIDTGAYRPRKGILYVQNYSSVCP